MAVLILLTIFFLIVSFGAIMGAVRGLNKALIRLVTMIPAVVMTVMLSGPITTAIAGNNGLGGALVNTVMEAAKGTDFVEILNQAPVLVDAIVALFSLLLSLIITPLLFLGFNFITWIIYLVVQKPLRRLIFKEKIGDEAETEQVAQTPAPSTGVRAGKRFAGLGIGVVSGILSFGVFLAPVFGFFSLLPSSDTVEDTLKVMNKCGIISNEDYSRLEGVYAMTDCALVKFYEKVGIVDMGRRTLDASSGLQINGQTMYMTNELNTVMHALSTAMECGMVEAILDPEDTSTLVTLLSDEELVDSIMQDLAQSRVVCTAAPYVASESVNTLATNMNVPADNAAARDQMFKEIEQAIDQANIDYSVLQEYDGNADEFYQDQLDKLKKLADAITNILDEYIAGDHPEFSASLADHIVEDIIQEARRSGSYVFDLDRILSEIDPSELYDPDGNAEALFATFSDPEKFETDFPTVESISASVQQTVKDATADEETAMDTASTLAVVLADFAGSGVLNTNQDGELDLSALDTDRLAEAITELQNSELKSVGSSLLDAISSGDLRNNKLVNDMLHSVKKCYDKGEDISNLAGVAGSLIVLATSSELGNADAQKLSVEKLIAHLTDDTVSLLITLLSDEVLTFMGIPAQYTNSSRNVIEKLLNELKGLDGTENYQNEVDSVLLFYKILTADTQGLTKEEVYDLAKCAQTSDAIFNTLVSISDNDPFGIQISDSSMRSYFTSAISEFYADSGKTERDYEICRAVSNLLGVDWNY